MSDVPAAARRTRQAVVITVSDGVSAGVREDVSGRVLADRLVELGFVVARDVCPDERPAIQEAVRAAVATPAVLVLTTGGTGLSPRDVTPQAVGAILDYEAPGFGELMRAEGARHTQLAYMSRSIAGVLGRTFIVSLPGSPRGALESLAAIEPLLDHALETMGGPFDHGAGAKA